MEQIFEFIRQSPPWFIYCILFFAAYIENILPIAPADSVVVFGAYLVGVGILRMELVIASTTLGSILGFMTLYFLAYIFEKSVLEKKYLWWIKKEWISKGQEWFNKYGGWIILLNRFFSGIRSVISILTGLAKIPWPKVLLLSSTGSLAWNSFLVYLGYTLGENWGKVENYLKTYSLFIIFAAVIVLGVLIIRKRSKRRIV